MYNMNAGSLLSVAENGPTPRTPEILNSLIAMTNPFDRLRPAPQTLTGQPASPPSDTASSVGSPPSVQHTCSQLIKEGLKLTIQTKRRNNGEMSPQHTRKFGPGRLSPDSQNCDTSSDGLTPEDEERRRRRRERNKIAATKCRLKKRERTVNLVYESEILETQNHDLKSKIQELETQRRRLVDILSVHRTNCNKQPFSASSSSFQDFPRSSQPIMEAHSSYSYSGPSTSYHHEVAYSRGPSGLVESSVMEESTSTNYLLHQGTSYSSSYKERDPVISYNRSIGEPIYTNLSSEVRSFSSSFGSSDSPNYSRSSALVINTSSSDYESNTELVDSPSTQHRPSYPFDDEGSFSASFTTSSCIT